MKLDERLERIFENEYDRCSGILLARIEKELSIYKEAVIDEMKDRKLDAFIRDDHFKRFALASMLHRVDKVVRLCKQQNDLLDQAKDIIEGN